MIHYCFSMPYAEDIWGDRSKYFDEFSAMRLLHVAPFPGI
jgi:hypothetical protein